MGDIEFIYLNQQDVRRTNVNMSMAIEAVEDAFRLHHSGDTNLPYKTVLDLGERERGRGNAMPAYVGGDYDVFGIKWISGFPQNPVQHNLPRGTGLVILNDSWKGIPLAVMDCTLLSAMRTGAVTGVLKWLKILPGKWVPNIRLRPGQWSVRKKRCAVRISS